MIAGLTRLNKKDFFTSDLWNTLMDILEAKFSGGVGTADLTYPLEVQGDIDFGQTYGIVGLRQFWYVVNAAEYSSLDAAVSAVEANGGGAVMIPPYPPKPIVANNVSIDSDNVTIFGFGPTSVIQITAANTGPLLTTASSGISDVCIESVALDGTGGGAGCVGVKAQYVTRFRMRNVYMTGFTGDFIQLTNDGTAGHACTDALLQDVHCSGGSASHLVASDVSGLTLNNFTSRLAAGDAISMVPAGSTNLIQDVLLRGVRVHDGGAKGVRIMGSGAAVVAQSRIHLQDCHVVAVTDLPYELGGTSALLKDLTVEGCTGAESGDDGMRIAASGGVITGNKVNSATNDGLDISYSENLWVHGNNCHAAGAYGINASNTTSCVVIGNNCSDATTDGVYRDSSTSLRAMENAGDDGPTVGNSFYDFGSYTRTAGAGAGDIGFGPYTIPANTFKTGDTVKLTIHFSQSAGGTGTFTIKFGATSTSTVTPNGTEGVAFIIMRPATGGSNTNFVRSTLRNDGTNNTSAGSAVVDWTQDQDMSINATATTHDIVVNGISVELLGSK